MAGRLDVEDDDGGAGLDVGVNLPEWLVDHQVHVLDEPVGQRLDERRADCHLRAEHVRPSRRRGRALDAGPVECLEFIAELEQVGG